MSFRRALTVPIAVALAASCAPVHILSEDATTTAGNGGASFTNPSPYTASLGEGGGGGQWFDAGASSEPMGTLGSTYEYLCGGSNPGCAFGQNTDNCAQGGYPGLGGWPIDGSVVSCKIVDVDGGASAQCGAWGTAGENSPCNQASDCAAGPGCVHGLTPVCLPYCCGAPDWCPGDTYCAPAAMEEAPSVSIPVCTPAANCALFVDIPCTAGQTCEIVRDDGTTSCVTPGTGKDGQACPCAKGLTCSWSTGACLTLCHTMGGTECGTKGYCQGGTAPYPDGVGVCVWTN